MLSFTFRSVELLSKTFHKRGLKALDEVDFTLRDGTLMSDIAPKNERLRLTPAP